MPPAEPQNSDEAMVQVGYRFALSLAGDPHAAEDLVQQACLRVLHKKGRLSSRSYLLTTIRNLFYDSLRRKKLVAFEPLEPMEAPSPKMEMPMPMPAAEEVGVQDSENLMSSTDNAAVEAILLKMTSCMDQDAQSLQEGKPAIEKLTYTKQMFPELRNLKT